MKNDYPYTAKCGGCQYTNTFRQCDLRIDSINGIYTDHCKNCNALICVGALPKPLSEEDFSEKRMSEKLLEKLSEKSASDRETMENRYLFAQTLIFIREQSECDRIIHRELEFQIENLGKSVLRLRNDLDRAENEIFSLKREGWQLVPLKPTDEMRYAASWACGIGGDLASKKKYAVAYAAMLKAAPKLEDDQ